METRWVDLVSLRLGFKVFVLNFYDGDIIINILAVFFSAGNIKLWMNCYFLDGQNDVILLLGVGGGVPLPTDHLRLSPRQLHSLRVGATVLRVSTETGAHVGTATVGNQPALLRLANIYTVGAGHQDCGTWGPGEQGDGTIIR